MRLMVFTGNWNRYLIRKPGDPNPKVKMGIADISTAKTIWIKTDYSDRSIYCMAILDT